MQSKIIGLVARGLTLAGLLGISTSLVWAQSDADRISANLAPVGDICIAGDPCSDAPGAAPARAASAPSASTASSQTPAAAPEPAAEPAATAEPAADDFDVAATYQMRCFACHGTGAAGAPMFGNADAWGERMAKGMDAVLANAINGLGAMPPRGLCMDCTDDQLVALINYMVDGG
ncbi:MAG: c-type cytochrome [Gammaproteobacteria bacterium]|nr:cytochrome c5 family protein [Pseudomonadales bacterium]MCP5347822.1 cytochrome c5 family protein [Pseudomonadales bacterium]